MSRVLLVHWNEGEAEERAARLRKLGYGVDCHWNQQDAGGLRAVRDEPPDAFVIDLGRVPSHGRAVGTLLRQQKATRRVPIVFVEGDPEKVALARGLLPDAVYTAWSRIRGDLRRAIRKPPAEPVVPGTMQSYTMTPLPIKLGIKPGSVVSLLGAPPGFERALGKLPEKVRLLRHIRTSPNLILLFCKSRAVMQGRFATAAAAMAEGGGLWIVWPKKASGVVSDLTENGVRVFGLAEGFVDYKICAVDQTWSGLLFARRRRAAGS
jgi:CheY-like chemotaxis protein